MIAAAVHRCRWLAAAVIAFAAALSPAQAADPVIPLMMTDAGPTGSRVSHGGWLGNYYPAAGAGQHPGVLVFGGSEGGLAGGINRIALALQAAGFSALQISYFRAPGQPRGLILIPLETFDDALAWLGARSGVDRHRLGLIGGSRGSEAALLTAVANPGVRAVVAGMPSNVVWPGIDWQDASVTASAWTRGGRPLPMLWALPGPDDEDSFPAAERNLAELPRHPDTAIPIARARAAVLLVCGEADTVWPSCRMARQLRALAPARVTLLAYPDAGHAVLGVPFARDDPKFASLAGGGGTAEGNHVARLDAWPKILSFLSSRLGLGRR